ncbi:uncharacterized protein LOC123005756 isoform X2 [Tribolium madens]|uniref:uncharacterized protein LOC123005756 isoform X2 n=1 Tax=Tribolium madens TaxID=41895 RepID=UPI001CF7259D|nr:uncharacterized protein LOC123005756 isoform X2 [Tribolium madens]
MNTHIFLFIIIIIVLNIHCEEEIGLPEEYICDKDGSVKSNDMTTIRLWTKNAQNYKFDVSFQTIGQNKCQNQQRCTLMNWKSVRDLNNYLQKYPLGELQNGLVLINNTMLIPGIKYILNVKIFNAGNPIDEKTLTFYVKQNVTKPKVSLLLSAPDTCYAYSIFVINARVNICTNLTTYYFVWELTSSVGSTVFSSHSSDLVIPPDTFQALENYTIWCHLISLDGTTVTEKFKKINVLSKGLLVRLPVKHLTTKTGQNVRIRAILRDFDNTNGDIKVVWNCLEAITGDKCDVTSDNSELETKFTPGLYEISVQVSSETDSCTVEVKNDVPVVEFEEIEFPVNTGVEIHATIYELQSFCTLQWMSPDLDLSVVPGNIINVTMKEDLFLNELEGFSNETFDRKFNLIIPPASDNWEGLKGDAKYLFRLVIKCPNFEEINETESVLTVSTSDVIIETNAPPKIQQLDVTPLEGDAFLTTFTFKTSRAEDKDGDAPILYKFGYNLENRDVILCNMADVTNCDVTLPFSDEGIQTFLECCDNFNSCGRVLGPLIRTKFPENVDNTIILQGFMNKILGEDYNKAFIEAFGILHSVNNSREAITQKIDETIDRYLNMVDLTDVTKYSVANLMKNINDFNPQLQLSESILNKVLELRNKFSDDDSSYTQRKLLSIRPKRAPMTLYDVRNYLEISELIITTASDPNKIKFEKEKLRKQLRNYMEKLCTNLKKTLTLELKTLVFGVEKLTKNNFISVPFDGNSWQINARIKLGFDKNTKGKCVGKAIFRDYLDKNGIIFFATILNENEGEGDVLVYLPKNNTAEGVPTCLVYGNNGWKSDCKVVQNIGNFVKCSCKYLGYYYLEYKQLVRVSTTVLPTENHPNETLGKFLDGNNNNTKNFIGIIILVITIRKVFHDDEDDEDETFDFPKYAQLHNEEYLNDMHI